MIELYTFRENISASELHIQQNPGHKYRCDDPLQRWGRAWPQAGAGRHQQDAVQGAEGQHGGGDNINTDAGLQRGTNILLLPGYLQRGKRYRPS